MKRFSSGYLSLFVGMGLLVGCSKTETVNEEFVTPPGQPVKPPPSPVVTSFDNAPTVQPDFVDPEQDALLHGFRFTPTPSGEPGLKVQANGQPREVVDAALELVDGRKVIGIIQNSQKQFLAWNVNGSPSPELVKACSDWKISRDEASGGGSLKLYPRSYAKGKFLILGTSAVTKQIAIPGHQVKLTLPRETLVQQKLGSRNVTIAAFNKFLIGDVGTGLDYIWRVGVREDVSVAALSERQEVRSAVGSFVVAEVSALPGGTEAKTRIVCQSQLDPTVDVRVQLAQAGSFGVDASGNLVAIKSAANPDALVQPSFRVLSRTEQGFTIETNLAEPALKGLEVSFVGHVEVVQQGIHITPNK